MPGRVLPYRFSNDGAKLVVATNPYKDLSFLTGAGSVYATAEDLFHFATAMRAGTLGKTAQDEVTSADGSWRGVYGRINSEASLDVLPSSNITLVLLTNLQSTVTWQLRAQLKNLLQRKPTTAIQRVGPVRPRFEPTSSFVGKYGKPSDSVESPRWGGNSIATTTSSIRLTGSATAFRRAGPSSDSGGPRAAMWTRC